MATLFPSRRPPESRPPGASTPPRRGAGSRRRAAFSGACTAALLVATALSTSSAHAGQPDPLDPEATVPTMQYRSALDGYRSHRVERVGRWGMLNDEVGRIGGWRTYARESAAASRGRPAGLAAPSSDPPARSSGETPVHPTH